MKSKLSRKGKTLRIIVLIGVVSLVSVSATRVDTDKYFEIVKNIELFTNIYKELNSHYVDDLDPSTLMRSGIDAMMNSLDPYTVYYSEAQVESYRLSDDNKYNGLGASSDKIEDKEIITDISFEGPAYNAGLKVGDEIKSVNGQSTAGRSHQDILQFIRGLPGTRIQIGVYRPLEKQSYSFDLTRSEVDVPNVPYSGMISPNVGYINLTTFTRDAGSNIARAMREMRDESQMKALVLDLRENGGGLLSEAIDICGLFLPKGSLIVSTKGKVRDRDQNFNTTRLPIDMEMPVVVLTNKNSASASEIVSGALQDYDRAVVMGQRTYGKGLVQNTREVGYNSRIKLTTSKYYIPSGRCIQSVAYENGEPKDIPDELREVFKTRNGRPVLDGGGVTPDLKLSERRIPEILEVLEKDKWVFKFANQYMSELKDSIDLESFAFDGYEQFRTYLKQNNFSYVSKAEIKIKEIKQLAEIEGYSVETEAEAVKAALELAKDDDLTQYQSQISKAIELEIIGRQHFQRGRTYHNLQGDPEVRAAIELLGNSERYNKLLKN